MTTLHKIFLLALMTVVSGNAEAASLTALYNSYTVNYQSVDANNNPITLSEKVTVNKDYSEIDMILFSQHPTTTKWALAPTGSDPQISQLGYMSDSKDKALTIAPDYIGYGNSVGTTPAYMCGKLTARNLMDGFRAAVEYVLTQTNNFGKNYYLASSYYTLNVGYSQGGYNAMMFQKYLETEASDADRDLVKLKKSICGAGPHQQTMMFDSFETAESLTYPLYLPYTIEGFMSVYAKSTMRGLKKEDIFTEKFLDTSDGYDILSTLHAGQTLAADVNTMIKTKFGGTATFYDIIRPEYKDRTSKLYRTLHKTTLMQDALIGYDEITKKGDWKPSHPIVFFHYTQDEVIPLAESQTLYNDFKAMGCDVTLYKADDSGGDVSVSSYWKIKEYDQTHAGYGTKFYLCIFSGALR